MMVPASPSRHRWRCFFAPLNRTATTFAELGLLEHALSFLSGSEYIFTAGVCREWRTASLLSGALPGSWKSLHGHFNQGHLSMGKRTSFSSAVESVDRLRWAMESGMPWGEGLKKAAASRAGVDVLEWLRARGELQPERTRFSFCAFSFCAWAGRGGNLVALRWAQANGFQWCNLTITVSAASSGSVALLEWLAQENKCGFNAYTCATAARGGHLELLCWLRANGCPWDASTSASAAEYGHLAVLQWSHANGCPLDEETFYNAARGGHVEVLKWLRARHCAWSSETVFSAILYGHLEAVQWLRANGCPWDASVCLAAEEADKGAAGDRRIMSEWVHANGCPCRHNGRAEPLEDDGYPLL